jgi:Tol biopolymer transport system component
MTTDLERRVRAGLREYVDAAPVTPPPPFAAAAAADRPRPGRARRIGLPLLAAAAVIAAMTLVPLALPMRDAAPDPAGGDRPSLPNRFAPFSPLTADLHRAPISRAVAIYLERNDALEDWYMSWHVLLLDADGDRYRRLAEASTGVDGDVRDQGWHLSPDGRSLAYFHLTPSVPPRWVVLDLASGAERPFPRDLGPVDGMLAWSDDGGRIAYSASSDGERPGGYGIWDLSTGRVSAIEGVEWTQEASFSPDGRRLAVRVGSEILIIDEGGWVARRLPLDDRDILAGPAAWSPDGTRVAVVRLYGSREVTPLPSPLALRLLPVDGDGADPAQVSLQPYDVPQGWRGTASFVVWDRARVVEISVATGARTPLAETNGEIADLQMAAGLLGDLVVREPGDVDRGPWPTWARVLVGLALTAVGLVALVLVLAVRHLRRRPDPVPPAG